MSSTSTHGRTAPEDARKGFVWSRLASFLAVLPLGAWTVFHVWNNLSAWRSGAAWERSVTSYASPVSQVVEMIIVGLPLLIHTIWGIGRLWISRPNNVRYPFYTNLKFLLQRASAVGVLAFLGAHVWLASIKPRMSTGHAETFADITHEMRHHGPTLVVYLLGTLGVSYHLANGLTTVAMSFGLVTRRESLRRLEGVGLCIFVVLLAMCWGAIFALYRAGA